MTTESSSKSIILHWAIHRNPTYLVSAGLMAAGARLFLDRTAGATGDAVVILLTFGLLQIYEWALECTLLTLHRAKRSPEDLPSLLLVATLFWTGPMAATVEMVALRQSWGITIAALAFVFSAVELRICCKAMALPLSPAGQTLGCAFLALLAIAAPLLKTQESDIGRNAILLYAIWWVFAAMVLGCLGIIHSHRPRSAGQSDSTPSQKHEWGFLLVTIMATVLHLIAMNYGFYCHASRFYGAPVIVALSVVGMGALSYSFRWYRSTLTLLSILPGVAIMLALQPFDSEFPVNRLPAWIRDPLVPVAIVSSVAWWFGYSRHRKNIMMHAGCGAIVLVVLRLTHGLGIENYTIDRRLTLLLFHGATAYLALAVLLLRSRREAVAALAMNLGATVILVHGRTPADNLIMCLVGGWTALAAMHICWRSPSLLWRLIPIICLTIVPWIVQPAPAYQLAILVHAATTIFIMFLAGQFWPWTRYRLVAGYLLIGHCLVGAINWMLNCAHPQAAIFVSAAFGTLVAGALVSWHKQRLLSAIRETAPAVFVDMPTIGVSEGGQSMT